ncbi:MAG: MauE/DoxX family redox-associated membrane protein [Fibrobacterota bacterium]
MKKILLVLNNPWFELACRYLLAGTFFYACVHKFMYPDLLAKIIYGYKIPPAWSINLSAIVLPGFEFAAALALLLGIFPRAAAIIINTMFGIFIIAIAFNLARGLQFDCGCFTMHKAGEFSDPKELLIRDIGYFLCGLEVIFYTAKRKFCLKQTGGLLTENDKTVHA